jgi:hypothetical protein
VAISKVSSDVYVTLWQQQAAHMPAQIVKLETAMRDNHDVIADQRTAFCKTGLRSDRLNSSEFKICQIQCSASAKVECAH